MLEGFRNTAKQTRLLWLLVSLFTILLIWTIATYLPVGRDYHNAFRPVVHTVFGGASPYDIPGFYNPPWAVIALIPFAILPESLGYALLVLVAMASLAYISYRLGAKPLAVALLLLSPPALHGYMSGNIDWLPALGYVMAPQIGLFFIAIKPQLGIGVGVFWLVESWREGGWRKTLRTFLPVSIALLASFVLFGLWPLKYDFNTADWWWNASLWPNSLPVGLALLVAALRSRRIEYAIAASPCFAPYVLFHSWVVVLIAIVAATPEFIASVTGLWGLIIIRATSGNPIN